MIDPRQKVHPIRERGGKKEKNFAVLSSRCLKILTNYTNFSKSSWPKKIFFLDLSLCISPRKAPFIYFFVIYS